MQTSKEMSQVTFQIEELDKWKRRLTITLPEADVESRRAELLAERAKTAQVDGFRKGKVPKEIIERQYGDAERFRAIESLLGPAYGEAVRESGLRPVCDPVIEAIDDKPSDGRYSFTATFEVRPEIELKDYEGIEITERVPNVANEDVDRAVEELREKNATLEPVARSAAPGDFAIIDYERLDDAGNVVPDSKVDGFPCELGSEELPPELASALEGVTAGDSKTVAITYPADYRVETMAGKTVSFAVRVTDVREKRLPPVDEAFAKSVAGAETILDLRVRVRTSLEAQAKALARRRLEEEIVQEVIKRNPFDLPECLVEERLDRMYERMTEGREDAAEKVDPEQFRKVYRPVVEQQLKAGILLGTLAEKHGIEVTAEDIEGRVAQVAAAQGREPAQLMEDLKDTDVLSQIEDDIWLTKVHELLVGLSKVTTEHFDPPAPDEAAEAGASGEG
jgi:trigger factor